MSTPMSRLKFFFMLMKSQWFAKIPVPTSSFAGQTVIVTGSNTGLGKEAARHVVRLGAARVILAVRTESKGQAAAEDILTTTKANKNIIEVWPLDMSDFDSIKAFAERAQGLDRLDAVLENAGINSMNWTKVHGEEQILRINLLGTVLLGLLLLPKLRESAKKYNSTGRLSFVGSDLQYVAPMLEAKVPGSLLDAMNDEKSAKHQMNRYPNSKLLLQYATREIAARSPLTPDSNVLVNNMTPGVCKSDLVRDKIPLIVQAIMAVVLGVLARTTEVGGRTLTDAVRPDLGKETHGEFLMDCKVFPAGPNVETATGKELAKRCNAEIFARLEHISPGVTKVLA
ncbi:retinol dehydrogenase 12 [Polyplosphaeria fusca]|uniref:Retinol dehydrogenase 12 n=1 Tax=Polyplosphaeria fusca TaxID=682080 RepID=A0A9P4QGI2_9PLEO|nr:retinol dehydrogenase 12 [Polyplosphaeria fusca]